MGTPDILEGVISEISPSGDVFKVDGKWYRHGSSYCYGDPLTAELLDEVERSQQKR